MAGLFLDGPGALRDQPRTWVETPKPTLFDEVPRMPEPALKVWHWYRKHLNGNRLYRPELGRLFAQLCVYEAWLDMYNLLEMPPSVQTPNGDIKGNPDLMSYDRILGRTLKLWEVLAIDPVYLYSRVHTPVLEGQALEGGKVIQLHAGRGMDGVE